MMECVVSPQAWAETSRRIARCVRGLCERAGLDERSGYRLRLAADEVTTNVYLHAYGSGAGRLWVDGGHDGSRVWLQIQDEGPPFDPRTHDPGPRLAEGVAGERGGFGLFLAFRSVDDFSYERVGECNVNVLTVYRSSVAEAEQAEVG